MDPSFLIHNDYIWYIISHTYTCDIVIWQLVPCLTVTSWSSVCGMTPLVTRQASTWSGLIIKYKWYILNNHPINYEKMNLGLGQFKSISVHMHVFPSFLVHSLRTQSEFWNIPQKTVFCMFWLSGVKFHIILSPVDAKVFFYFKLRTSGH